MHPSTQGPAVGAAVLGALAGGQFAGIGEAVGAMAQPPSAGRVVEPRREMKAVCDTIYERYRLMAATARADQALTKAE